MPTSLGTIYGDVRLRTDTLTSDAGTIKGVFADLRNTIANLFDGVSPVQPFVDALAGLPATAEGAMAGVANAVKTGVDEAATAAEEGMSGVADAVKVGGDDASTAAESGASRIAEAFTALREKLGGIGGSIGESINGAFTSISESGDALVEHLGGAGEGLHKLGDGFKETLKHGLDFAAGMLEFQALSGAGQAIGEFASNLIGMNATFESLHQQLTSITGSGGAADKILTWVKDFGEQVPDTTEHLAQAVVTIQSLGINATQIMPSIANVAAAMGTDLPTAAHAFADAFEGRFIMLQQQLHISKDQLEQFGLKMDKTGKVDSKSLIEAFEKLSQAKFGNAIKNQMQTLQGQLSNLQDRIEFFAMRIGGPIFDAAKQALAGLFGFLDAHKKDIDALADAVGGALAGAFHVLGSVASSILDFFRSHREAVDALKVAFLGLGAALVAFLITLLPSIPAMIAGLGALAITIGGLIAAAAPFIAIGAAVAGLVIAIKHAYDTSVPFRTAVQDLVGQLRAFGQHVLEAGQALLTKLQPFIAGALTHIQAFATELGERVGPALTNIAHFLEMVSGIAGGVFLAIWPTLRDVLAGVWQAIQGIIEIAWDVISGIFKVALDVLGGNWGKAWNDLKDMLGGVWDGILNLLGGVLHMIGSLLGGLGDLFGHIVGPLGEGIKNAFGSVFGAIGQSVGTFIGTLGQIFGGIVGQITYPFRVVAAFIGEQIAVWRARFQIGVAAVQEILQVGFHRVQEVIEAPIRFVENLFHWLFDHNYYFHNLVVSIQNAFTNAKAFVTNIWNGIKQWLADRWHDIQADAEAAWNLVQTKILQPIHDLEVALYEKILAVKQWILDRWHDFQQDAAAAWLLVQQKILKPLFDLELNIHNKILQVRQWLLDRWNDVKQDAQQAWDRFVGAITGVVGKVKDAIGQVISNITTPIKNLATVAVQWGKNLIQGFIDGITGMIDKVKNAAQNVINGVKNILGFHSPAKEGPGSDADRWAPNLMSMFAEGLTSGTPAITAAATRAAHSLRGALAGLGGNGSGLSLATSGAGANGAGAAGVGGDVYIETLSVPITVHSDSTEGTPEQAGATFGSSLGQAFAQELQQRGFRNG